MGVRGLLSTCLRNSNACSDTFDLVKEARQQNGIELIVDYSSFKHHILLKFWIGLSKLRRNDYLYILGGEYASLHNYVTKLVNDLKSRGIHLVFYIDGEKGSSIEGSEQKLDTWKKRHMEDTERLSLIFNVLQQKTDISKLPWETQINPVLLDDQFMASLRLCDCEIHQSPAGEADLPIIRALRDRPKAFAILSNDADFCVFKESRLIPDKLFDIENDLKLREPRELPEQPRKLIVKVISTENVMAMLGKLAINTNIPYLHVSVMEILLVEMSIVAGNDYTGPYMQRALIPTEYTAIRSMSNLTYRTLPTGSKLSEKLTRIHIWLTKHDPGFRQAVIHSRNFYNLIADSDKCPQKGDFSQDKICSGQYPSNIMSMHNHFYWYRMLLEDNRLESCLSHRYVLTSTTLFSRKTSSCTHIQQVEAKANVHAPPLDTIEPDKILDNLETVHTFTSTGATVNWFERYGRKKGFICYILRYFLLLNWRQNLQVIEDEFLALVAMVMGRWGEKKYQAIVIRPTVRCVTIGNWIQDVYRHGYHMFGSVLHIRHEFPLPRELFSGSVWTAMYMVCQDA
ncbi:hypothetical protein MAR_003946, partial [Mya arenaria]